jgi:hypothetical protein
VWIHHKIEKKEKKEKKKTLVNITRHAQTCIEGQAAFVRQDTLNAQLTV